jgi:hypothetical protein
MTVQEPSSEFIKQLLVSMVKIPYVNEDTSHGWGSKGVKLARETFCLF